MVSQHGEHAEGGAEASEFDGRRLGRHEPAAEHALDHVIAEEQDGVRPGRVRALDDPAERRAVLVRRARVEVGEEGDAQAAR